MKRFFLFLIISLFLKPGISQTYTFNGNGYWSITSNWINNTIPPTILPAGSTIYVSPAAGDSCVLDVVQKISPGASLIISTGANFIISGNINGSVPIITTNAVSSIKVYEATVGGNVLDDGGSYVYSKGVAISTSHNPPWYGLSIRIENENTQSFERIIQGLSSSTTYYARAFATNSTGTAYGNEVSFTTPPIGSTVICNQEWMTANLDVVTYRNGDTIPQVTNKTQWDTITTGAWCYYGFYSENYCTGKFYNSYAVKDRRGLAPTGWHVPCDTEWSTLVNCLGGNDNLAGNKMRDSGTKYWVITDTSFNNSSGFNALGAGRYGRYGVYNTTNEWDYLHLEFGPGGNEEYVSSTTFRKYAYWWSTTEAAPGNYMCRWLFDYYDGSVHNYRIDTTRSIGPMAYAVRCVKGDVNLVCSDSVVSVSTDSVTSVGHNYCSSWATIQSNTISFVSERGFVWDSLPAPTIAKNKKITGNGTGRFSTTITGLLAEKIYYLRAYAINPSGITYGNEISFITANKILPSVVTWFISNENTTAVSGGRIADNGGDSIFAKGIAWSITPNPTTTNFYISGGAGTETYKANIVGLNPGTIYYIRAYATNSAGTAYGNEVEITTAVSLPPSAVICDKIWMQKNLDVSHYRNGDAIPQITDSATWVNLTTGAWCWYNNDSASYGAVYGKLYNWYAVNDPRGLAPEGWHIPDDTEWRSLFNCAGGTTSNNNLASVVSNALRDTGQLYWRTPNQGANNNTGFTALPAGLRAEGFFEEGRAAGFWSTHFSLYNGIFYAGSPEIVVGNIFGGETNASYGHSVRCIRN